MKALRWLVCVAWLGSGALSVAQVESAAPVAITVPAAKLAEYVGTYRLVDEPEVLLAVSLEDGKLYVEGERSPRTELQASAPDHFFWASNPAGIDFARDAAGKVTGGTVNSGGRRGGPLMGQGIARVNDTAAKLNHFRDYTRQEVMIPMRDGVKLHAVILRPAGSETSGEALPFLMQRTPYGVDGAASPGVNAGKPELAASGYIFVFADIRGRYKSEGQFVMTISATTRGRR